MDVRAFLMQSGREIESGYIIAALTDRYIVEKWPLSKEYHADENHIDENHVLEIRIFNDVAENRLVRGDISESFCFRRIDDRKDNRDRYDEWQYLDIDEKAVPQNGYVRATGGGRYHLPLRSTRNARVLIRCYLGRYEETGQARVEDWRVVGFQCD